MLRVSILYRLVTESLMLPSPSLVCSLHNRPIIKRLGVEARKSNFIQKVRHPRRWLTRVLESQFSGVCMLVYFIE